MFIEWRGHYKKMTKDTEMLGFDLDFSGLPYPTYFLLCMMNISRDLAMERVYKEEKTNLETVDEVMGGV